MEEQKVPRVVKHRESRNKSKGLRELKALCNLSTISMDEVVCCAECGSSEFKTKLDTHWKTKHPGLLAEQPHVKK